MGLLDSVVGGGGLLGLDPFILEQLKNAGKTPTVGGPLPPAAQSAFAQAPQGGAGFGDRLQAGGAGFFNSASPMQAIGNLIGGIATGQRQDPIGVAQRNQQTNQQAIYQSLLPKVGHAGALAAALNPKVMESFFTGQKQSDDIREYEYAKTQGYKGTLADWMAIKRGGAGEFGLQPVWGTNEKGEPALVQLGKQGNPIQPKMPEGFKISRDPVKVDLGTHFALIDPQSRQVVGTLPKDIAGAEAAKKIGAGQGDAAESLSSIKSKMPGLEKVVADLDRLSETATYTAAGRGLDELNRQFDRPPRPEALARAQYIAMVDNQILPLLRDTFGAQFTEREGATLRATLGDPNKSPKEKQAVLKAFIEQKRRDVGALESRVGGSQPSAKPTGQVRKYNPATGKIE